MGSSGFCTLLFVLLCCSLLVNIWGYFYCQLLIWEHPQVSQKSKFDDFSYRFVSPIRQRPLRPLDQVPWCPPIQPLPRRHSIQGSSRWKSRRHRRSWTTIETETSWVTIIKVEIVVRLHRRVRLPLHHLQEHHQITNGAAWVSLSSWNFLAKYNQSFPTKRCWRLQHIWYKTRIDYFYPLVKGLFNASHLQNCIASFLEAHFINNPKYNAVI